MNRTFLCVSLVAAVSCLSLDALADNDEHPYHPEVKSTSDSKLAAGFGFDVGVPDGAALGLVIPVASLAQAGGRWYL